MEVRKGYKQTDVGMIPEDWEVLPIDCLYDFQGGSQPPRHTFIFEEKTGYVRLLQIRDYKNDKYASYIPIPLAKRSCTATEIMIGRYGPPIFQILHGMDGSYNVALMKAVPSSKITQEYGWYLLKQNKLFDFVEKLSQRSSGQTGVDLNELRKYLIPLPPTKSEQTAIATALSDADALITSLEKLIEKKRAIKQGAMQELLRPKEGWEVKRLGEIADILTGFPFPSSGYSKTGIRLLRGSNIKRGNTDWNEDICQYWPKLTVELLRYQLNCGDIVVAMDGSLVGKSFAQLSQLDLPAILLQRVARIRSTVIDINYLKELVCSEIFTGYCDSVKTSSAIPHISPADIYNYNISYPFEKSEQTRIATLLSDMDAEITALEQKLGKYKLVKQGMMQELLTGRIRLI